MFPNLFSFFKISPLLQNWKFISYLLLKSWKLFGSTFFLAVRFHGTETFQIYQDRLFCSFVVSLRTVRAHGQVLPLSDFVLCSHLYFQDVCLCVFACGFWGGFIVWLVFDSFVWDFFTEMLGCSHMHSTCTKITRPQVILTKRKIKGILPLNMYE